MITVTSLAGAVIAISSVALLLKYWAIDKRAPEPNITNLKLKCESLIEEILFDELIRRNIFPHPQYEVGHYRLDFAISPQLFKINVECDGRDYHDYSPQIEKDRRRNVASTSEGWAVLRFSGSQIYKDVKYCGQAIEQTLRARQKQFNKRSKAFPAV